MDLGPCTSFLPWDPETQDLKIVFSRKTLETQDLNILIGSETLKTQDFKILIVARPWKPRTLTRAPLGGIFRAPPLVFLRYLLNRCMYHRQTCSTLSPYIFTHCVKNLKSRVS